MFDWRRAVSRAQFESALFEPPNFKFKQTRAADCNFI